MIYDTTSFLPIYQFYAWCYYLIIFYFVTSTHCPLIKLFIELLYIASQ